jgi:hypothetical protein
MLFSVALYVLSEESGTPEEIAEFYESVNPDYLLDDEYDVVMKELKRMNRENQKLGTQKHRGIVLRSKVLAQNFEDAGREETEYFCVVLKLIDNFEEFQDDLSNLINSQGLVARAEGETIKEFAQGII